jgi:hypothetical protein
MNWITSVFGVFVLGFGIYSGCVRLISPQKFGKLKAMEVKFGTTAVTSIQIAAYSVVPIVAGIHFIVRGIRGISLF